MEFLDKQDSTIGTRVCQSLPFRARGKTASRTECCTADSCARRLGMAEIPEQFSAHLCVTLTRAPLPTRRAHHVSGSCSQFCASPQPPSSGQTLLSVQGPDSVKVRRLWHGSPQPSGECQHSTLFWPVFTRMVTCTTTLLKPSSTCTLFPAFLLVAALLLKMKVTTCSSATLDRRFWAASHTYASEKCTICSNQ